MLEISCYLLCAWLISFAVLHDFVHCIRASYGFEKVLMLKKGVSVVIFDSVEQRDQVLQLGCFHFDKKPLIVRPCTAKAQKEKVESVPVWMQFLDLDLEYWSASFLSKLASILAMPIVTDQHTQPKT